MLHRFAGPAHRARHASGKLRHPFRLGVQGAELALEDDVLESFQARFEAALAVGAEEIRGIAQPGPNDPLVALAHRLDVAALDVAHRDEVRHQRAVVAGDGEVALVSLHRRDEHRVGENQELGVEVAGDRDRPFDERGVLLEQRGVDERSSAEGTRRALDLFADHFHALLDPGHDVTLAAQRRHVSAHVIEHDVFRVVEAVPAGGAPGRDAKDLPIDDVHPVHQHHPVHGAHELVVAVRPPHPARHRQPGERSLQHPGQQGRERCAGLGGSIGEPRPLRGFEPHEPIHLDPDRFREAEGGPRRLVVLVERARERRASPFDLAVGLRAGHAGNEDCEPSRGGIGHRSAVGKPRRVEFGRDFGHERFGQHA